VAAHGGRTWRRAELSQHFLRKGATAAELVASTSIQPSDLVVEIGAGRGALTRALVGRCARLIAVEIDQALAADLRRDLDGRAEVVTADFLAFEPPRAPYKVIGNLPFSRTTEIVRSLTQARRAPEDAWLVVQREAARRLVGAPYGRETLLSLWTKPGWHCEIVRDLRRSDFEPPPAVESALLWLMRRERPLVAGRHLALYRRFTAAVLGAGVGAARALSPWLTRTQIARLAHDLHFDPVRPPSALRFEQWLAIFRFVARGAGASR
jgi:23S rRNA (adenine-N6)-dimethyltransferase